MTHGAVRGAGGRAPYPAWRGTVRPSMTKAKYATPEHKAARQAIDQAQARGETLWCVEPVCVMPSRSIAPWQRADVCHDPSGTVITGPGHSRCNRREGAARGNRMRRVLRRVL